MHTPHTPATDIRFTEKKIRDHAHPG